MVRTILIGLKFKNHSKKTLISFGNKQIAFIDICCLPDGAKLGAPWVLAISLNMMKLNNKGGIDHSGDLGSWSLELLLYKDDLAKRPFKFELVKQLFKMGYNKVVQTVAGAAHGYAGLNIIEETKKDIIEIKKLKNRRKSLLSVLKSLPKSRLKSHLKSLLGALKSLPKSRLKSHLKSLLSALKSLPKIRLKCISKGLPKSCLQNLVSVLKSLPKVI